MVKDIKYIIKRVLIGTLIALALMYFKGGLIGNVYAASGSIGTGSTSPSDCVQCYRQDLNLGNSFNNWKEGDFTFNVSINNYTLDTSGQFSQIIGNAYVTANNNTDYACHITGTTNPRGADWVEGRGWEMDYLTATYSMSCHVIPGTTGITSLHVAGFGYDSSASIRIWYPMTFTESDSSAITGAINNNTTATNNQTNTIKDESDPNTNGFLQDVQQDYTNNPVSDLITMPITFLQRLNNNINGSCTTWNLGSLLGTNLTMPCINLSNILGATLYNLIDMAICLFLAYNLGLMCVTIWNNMTSLKDDFDDMYSPKHAYNGKHGGGS